MIVRAANTATIADIAQRREKNFVIPKLPFDRSPQQAQSSASLLLFKCSCFQGVNGPRLYIQTTQRIIKRHPARQEISMVR
jgi:hypothetical protein